MGSMARNLLIVGLVILLLLLVIPLGIGMAMSPCPECSHPVAVGMAMCLAILTGLIIALSQLVTSVGFTRPRRPALLLASMYERPPRSL